jgi:hypothetical protein
MSRRLSQSGAETRIKDRPQTIQNQFGEVAFKLGQLVFQPNLA